MIGTDTGKLPIRKTSTGGRECATRGCIVRVRRPSLPCIIRNLENPKGERLTISWRTYLLPHDHPMNRMNTISLYLWGSGEQVHTLPEIILVSAVSI